MSTKFKRIAAFAGLALLPLALIVIMTYPRIATGAAILNDAFPPDNDAASITGADPSAPSPDGPQQIGLPTGYAWNYSAKFVCGVQPLPNRGRSVSRL